MGSARGVIPRYSLCAVCLPISCTVLSSWFYQHQYFPKHTTPERSTENAGVKAQSLKPSDEGFRLPAKFRENSSFVIVSRGKLALEANSFFVGLEGYVITLERGEGG